MVLDNGHPVFFFMKSIFYSENGIWSCTVNARKSQDSDNFQLLVEPQPDFSIIKTYPEDRLRIEEGEKIELGCEVNDEFESCSFDFSGKTCTRGFYDNSRTNCQSFGDRIISFSITKSSNSNVSRNRIIGNIFDKC